MGEMVIVVVQLVGYVGVGMVEFLVDFSGDYYFLEMNMWF